MMDHDDIMFPHIAVDSAVMLFEELSPDIRIHEQAVFCTPVIMGKDGIRFQVVNDHFGILETVLGDSGDQTFHIIRLQQEIHQRIFKSHKEMTLFKDTGSHKAHHQFLAAVHLGGAGKSGFPSVAAVGCQIRNLYIFFPFSHIRADLIALCHMRHRAGCVLGEENFRSPSVHGVGAADTVAAGVNA